MGNEFHPEVNKYRHYLHPMLRNEVNSPLCTSKESRATLACLNTELQGNFYMQQLIYVDSRHFTQSYLSIGWSDLHEIKNVICCISSSD